jgi:hypothetical protein
MDTIQQAASSVNGDVSSAQAAVATVGAEAAGVAGDAVADVAAGASDAATDAETVGEDAKDDENVAASDADTLFGKVKGEIEGLVDLAGHEWDLLKAAITKHL